jgi:hypothetical protein
MIGCEIEQVGMNTHGIAVQHNDNPTGLPYKIPYGVENRASIYHWHYDASGPGEFSTPPSQFESEVKGSFDAAVGSTPWYWTNEFVSGGDHKGCGSHIHFSVVGDCNLGDSFANQQVGNAEQWAIIWNNMVELGPLFAAFWSFGLKYRSSALNKWAVPVSVRLSPESIIELFERGSSHNSRGENVTVGHPYTYPAFNRHAQKVQITVENRLCENHPYWTLPAVQLLGTINSACFKRNKSMKLTKECHGQLHTWWNHFQHYQSYKALSMIRDIEFLPGRGLPYLCGGPNKNGSDMGGTDRIYPDGLNLFRMLCRRFMKSKMNSPINYGKVMRMYQDMIDVNKLPANLIWNVDEVYRRLYEDDDCQRYQDAYLFLGSRGVTNPNIEGRFRALDLSLMS